jgi:ribose 5-phosphate isomerase A
MAQMNSKQLAGERAVDFVESGMVVGLGSGSTAVFAVMRIGQLLKEGALRDIVGIPTSLATEKLAKKWNIPLTTLQAHPQIDLTIDGADEVDPQKNLIKGGGGALLHEKIVARASRREIIVVDESKLVPYLGHHFLLPVEVVPFGWNIAARQLEKLGCQPKLRMSQNDPYLTDERNYILDCAIPRGAALPWLERAINKLPGVVENGLFLGCTERVIVGSSEGVRIIT